MELILSISILKLHSLRDAGEPRLGPCVLESLAEGLRRARGNRQRGQRLRGLLGEGRYEDFVSRLLL